MRRGPHLCARYKRLGVSGCADHFDSTVIIAVIAIRMMQVAFHQIIDVIAVGNGFMTASSTMLV